MPIYEFQCQDGHLSEHLLPISSQARNLPCTQCGSEAKRLISAPAVSTADPARISAIDSAKKSAYEPTVVSSLPNGKARKSTPVTRDPRHQALPKP